MMKFLVSLILILILDMQGEINANSEADALIAVKEALIDPHNYLKSWDPSLVDPCSWFHITCNTDSRVIRIDLSNDNLSGHLAPDVGKLTKLQYLELYGNSISGAIPNEIGNLASLVSLDLYNNGFNGPIPTTIGNLSQLKFLRLNNNDLSGCIPFPWWRKIIPHLVDLNLSNNPRARVCLPRP